MPEVFWDTKRTRQIWPRVEELPGSPDFVLSSVGLSHGPVPGRGLVYSVVLHIVAVLAVLMHLPSRIPPYQHTQEWQLTMFPKGVIYLPSLGGGSAGSGRAGGGSTSAVQNTRRPSVAAQGSSGASYPGRQAIVSNPPNPTNRIQTLLQPRIPNLPRLNTFVPLPNMVRMVSATTPKITPPRQPSSTRPQGQPKAGVHSVEVIAPHLPPAPVAPLIRHPKLVLPASVPQGERSLLAFANLPPLPAPPLPKGPDAGPLPQPISPVLRRALHPVLAISPLAVPLRQKLVVPRAEARGRFVISPLPKLAMLQAAQGSPSGNTLSAFKPGMNSSASAANAAAGSSKANAAANNAAGGASGPSSTPGTGAAGSAGGTSNGSSGSGTANGPGAGNGPGTGTGTGHGAGAAPGGGAFPGMTIESPGWEDGAFSSSGPSPSHTPANQQQQEGSYNLEIVATGGSGGGLADFGVFRNETVATVYINLSKGPATFDDPPAPSWTLEYAALQPSSHGALSAPYPITKVSPKLPTPLVRRYFGQTLVAYALISVKGKLTDIRVLQTPTAKFTEPVAEALKKWLFRPAKLNGQPVIVKVLLGIPL